MNLVPIWVSRSPGDYVPHLDLIAVDSFLASPGSGESDPICASPRSGLSGPHLWTISWPHLELVTLILSARLPDLVTLVLTWASLVPGDSVPHLCLTWT